MLTYPLSKESGRSLYEQLYEGIRRDILSGHPHHLNNNANNDNICCVVELHDVFHVFLPRFVFDVSNFITA